MNCPHCAQPVMLSLFARGLVNIPEGELHRCQGYQGDTGKAYVAAAPAKESAVDKKAKTKEAEAKA